MGVKFYGHCGLPINQVRTLNYPSVALVISLLTLSFCAGCAFLGLKSENKKDLDSQSLASDAGASSLDETIRFSENPNIGVFNDRRYKRSTRRTLEDESDLDSRAGSLWNTEGPSSYLFAQNKLRREGDLLNLKLEGHAKTQMETKIQVIKKLLARLEIVPSRSPESPSGSSPLAENQNEGGRSPAAIPATSENSSAKTGASLTPSPVGANSALGSQANKVNSEASSTEGDAPIQVESIPTRVTERMVDGNYRVKGQQSFMIGKKEFKVIITGLVRPEDFTDEGMGSDKLLDPQLDIVSLRRSLQ